MASNSCGTNIMIWSPKNLSKRVKKLRDEYFNFYERDFKNEVEGYTTGTDWDQLWSLMKFSVVPDVYFLGNSFEYAILSTAKKVNLPDGFWDLPLVVRKATFFDIVLSNEVSIDILEGELIIGGKFNLALSKCLNEEERKEHKGMEGKFLRQLKEINDIALGNCGPTPGHLIPNYPKILKLGFKGVAKEIEKELSKTPAENEQKINQLKAMLITCKTTKKFSDRYSKAVKVLAEKEVDENRRKELLKMSEICMKIPWEPAQTFWEAVQSLWFTHMLVMVDESYPGPGLSFGRIDQYLYPFYKKDIDSGKITKDWSKEILECLWIKSNYAYDYQGRIGNNQGINSGFGQLITLAGMGPDGQDLSNDLTYLMLEIINDINMLEPKPNVRLHKNTPDKLLNKIIEMLLNSQGSPFLLNFDEISMNALKFILPKEVHDKIWDYAPVGCLENTLQGCDRSGTVDVNLNISKAVEFVLFNGADFKTQYQFGPETGDPFTFKSWNEFYDAYIKQLDFTIEKIIDINNLGDEIRATYEPTPYLSTLVDGCVEKGLDITQGGAVYNFITVEGVGFATAVDSLLAIEKLVYEDKKTSLSEIIEAIKSNYEGYEPLRLMLQNKAPKYGNDDEYADTLAHELNDYWTRKVTNYETKTHKRYRAGYLSWNYWICYGATQTATPNGRKMGTFLSNGVCPSSGCDVCGPTSNIKSVGKIGLQTVPNGGSHTMSFNPMVLKTKADIEKFKDLLKTYMDVGGSCLQINMIDAETLKEAQKHPQDYRNLLVRVTGYNAYFVTLGSLIQDEIISRISHEV